jgi:hypothetical protein
MLFQGGLVEEIGLREAMQMMCKLYRSVSYTADFCVICMFASHPKFDALRAQHLWSLVQESSFPYTYILSSMSRAHHCTETHS